MNKIHEDDNEVLLFILRKFTEKADEGLEHFSCHEDVDYYGFTHDEPSKEKNPTKSIIREYVVTWNNKNHYYRFSFTPVYGTVSINIGNSSQEFDVGFGAKHKKLKMSFMKLYHRIDAYQKIELPRIKRERFINDVAKIFPDLLDHMILGGEDENEKEKEEEGKK